MKKYKVTPTRNGVNAPSIIIMGERDSEAIRKAKLVSGLARFASWSFNAVELRTNK